MFFFFFLVSNDTMKITYEYIREAGIKDEEAQEAIMNAIRIYNQGTDRNLYSKSKELTRDEVQTPTAPAVVGSPSCSNIITNDNGINAETSVMNSECVICMDQEVCYRNIMTYIYIYIYVYLICFFILYFSAK